MSGTPCTRVSSTTFRRQRGTIVVLNGYRKKARRRTTAPANSTRQRGGNAAILPNNVNADELLPRDHEFGRRQFHLVDRRKCQWCVAARGPVAVERGHHRRRQVRQFIGADDGARRD